MNAASAPFATFQPAAPSLLAGLKDGHMAQSQPMGTQSTSSVEIIKYDTIFYYGPAIAQVTLALMGSGRKEGRSLEVTSESPG